MRANVDDLQRRGDDWALLVHGKSHDRLVFLRPDVAEALRGYLAARGRVQPDADGEPLLAAVGNFASGHGLSRRGVRRVVDSYLRAAKVKRPRVSNHALRHTGATLAYRYTPDLRAVQDMLGHQDPNTTARYARVVDRAKTNPALKGLSTCEVGLVLAVPGDRGLERKWHNAHGTRVCPHCRAQRPPRPRQYRLPFTRRLPASPRRGAGGCL
jgi:integrase